MLYVNDAAVDQPEAEPAILVPIRACQIEEHSTLLERFRDVNAPAGCLNTI
jgi:hypothetical protein